MSSTGKTKLTLLQGGADSAVTLRRTEMDRALLRTVAAPHQPVPKQLELLPDPAQCDRLLVVRYPFLDFEAFRQLIVGERIRTVADVRGSPSFFGRGFTRSGVLELLEQHGAVYRLRATLANPFIGQSWDHNALVRQYFEYLQHRQDELTWLRDVIRQGPVLLLGGHREFHGSDVAALVDALAHLDDAFTLELR